MSHKNVNIITIHNEPNYGALLQAYALYHITETLGYSPRMINLGMQFRKHPYNMPYRILIGIHNWLKGYNHCYQIAQNFCRKNEPRLLGNFQTVEQLRDYPWDRDDIYLVGSDQVWNPFITGNLQPAYTLSFLADECTNRYSYAASLGHIKDEAQRVRKLDIQHTLKRFKQITVREQFGVEFLQKNGVHATEVIDPTLLVDNYDHLLPRKKEDIPQVLYLALGEDEPMDHFAQEVAKKYHLPLKKVYGYLQPSRKINKKFLPVEEWLYQIACSRVIVTDSFHAMVFSVLFGRDFYVYISNPSKVFRIENLLKKLNLHQRIVSDIHQVHPDMHPAYDEITLKLAEYRKSSLNKLNDMLKENL